MGGIIMRKNRMDLRGVKKIIMFLVLIGFILLGISKLVKGLVLEKSFEDRDEYIEEVEERLDLEKEKIKLEEQEKQKKQEKVDKEKKRAKELEENVVSKKTIENEKKIDSVEKQENLNVSYDFKEIFKNDLFLGDSRTDSLDFYGVVQSENVISDLGLTAKKAMDKIDSIVERQPENIFIMLGINDILNEKESVRFIDNYKKLTNSIGERLPETNIYIQSIPPVHKEVKEKKPLLTNDNINNFNNLLEEFVNVEDLNYVNLNYIIEENNSLLEPDGIHFKYEFYKIWLGNLVEKIK